MVVMKGTQESEDGGGGRLWCLSIEEDDNWVVKSVGQDINSGAEGKGGWLW